MPRYFQSVVPALRGRFTVLNRICSRSILLVALGISAVAWADGPPQPVPGPVPMAPPPAPPIEVREGKLPPPPPVSYPKGGPTLYSIGQPTPEEQLYLEFINRSRAAPPAEGARLAVTTDPDVLSAYTYFNVDLALMQSQFNAIAAVPPLAMNSQLLDAARWHSGDMYTNAYQGHDQTNGAVVMNPGARITAKGYPWSTYGENVYSYAESPWHGHAGFNVDWGYGTGGMQTPPGHRNSIHNASFREIGVGVVNGVNGSVGPQLVTQDFATRQGAVPILTGVAYYDFNGNQFYDVGEGIGGITVNVPGSTNYAVTANSGGYAVPVSTNGNYTMTFTATGLSTQRIASVVSSNNVKIDFVPAYQPPVASGPNPASVNQNNTYTFNSVGGATSYKCEQTRMVPYTTVEGAEGGTGNVTIQASAGYSVYATGVAASGSYSFHLAQPDATDQFITLNALLLVRADSQLTFMKRLGYAGSGQVLRAQISADNGTTWQNLWSQTGSGGAGESGFSQVSISLASYAGQTVQFRFVYDFVGGSYYNQTSSGVGAYLDNIMVLNVDQASSPVATVIPSGTNFVFNPTLTGDYLLRVRGQNNGTDWPWGPSLRVSTIIPPPSLLALTPVVSGNQVQIEFTVSNPAANMTFQLWKSATANGTFAVDNSATFQTLTPNTRFRATTTTGGAATSFYKVRLSY
jgi:hypothetical protein